jgi:hypothetical protein
MHRGVNVNSCQGNASNITAVDFVVALLIRTRT